jgi:hypothetical protein
MSKLLGVRKPTFKQKLGFVKTELLGIRVKPAKQLEGTCWFYSIVNLIKHSPILRNNIAYSVQMHKNLQNSMNTAKNRPNVTNRCSEQELYYRTLKLVAGNKINANNLANFMNTMSRKVLHSAYVAPPRRGSNAVPRTTFRNVKRQLLNVGASPSNQLRVFKILLRKLKLPDDVISTTPKDGYKLVGSFLGFNMKFRNKNQIDGHAIIGTYSRLGSRIILNSAYPEKIYRINWNAPYNTFSANFRSKWNTIPWSEGANIVSVDTPIDIYVKKLY